MKELLQKSFWRGVVKTFVEAREGVHSDRKVPLDQGKVNARPASESDRSSSDDDTDDKRATKP